MSYPFLSNAQVLDPGTSQELDTLVTRLRTFLQVAHQDNGSLYPSTISSVSILNLLTADPAAPADDTAWFTRTGTIPAMAIDLKLRISGATYTIPIATL